MDIGTTHSTFFSPTGTSRAVVDAISRGMGGEEAVRLDLTRRASSRISFQKAEVMVVGMPVYGGRLPPIAVERFRMLEGSGTPAVTVVIYGNRAYGDALAELYDLCAAQGFNVVAAAAFIGQHSFSTETAPIALGRPDRQDLEKAETFGRQIRESLNRNALLPRDSIPGNFGKEPMQAGVAATAADPHTCTQCGACAEACPVGLIEMVDGMPQTWQQGCIWCMACIQACPTGARIITLPKIHESAQRLHSHFNARREPEIFLPLENKHRQ